MYRLSPIAFRRTALRPIAVVLAVFCLLASGRAFVPGLCATQRELPSIAMLQSDAACHVSPGGGCCDTLKMPRSADQPVPAGDAHCAFCYLAKAVAHTPAIVFLPVPPRDYMVDPVALQSALRHAELNHLLAGRAPPALS